MLYKPQVAKSTRPLTAAEKIKMFKAIKQKQIDAHLKMKNKLLVKGDEETGMKPKRKLYTLNTNS